MLIDLLKKRENTPEVIVYSKMLFNKDINALINEKHIKEYEIRLQKLCKTLKIKFNKNEVAAIEIKVKKILTDKKTLKPTDLSAEDLKNFAPGLVVGVSAVAINVSGFTAYTITSSTLNLLSCGTLPFGGYIAASNILSFISGPVGITIGCIGIVVPFFIRKNRTVTIKTMLLSMMLHELEGNECRAREFKVKDDTSFIDRIKQYTNRLFK